MFLHDVMFHYNLPSLHAAQKVQPKAEEPQAKKVAKKKAPTPKKLTTALLNKAKGTPALQAKRRLDNQSRKVIFSLRTALTPDNDASSER